VNFTHFLANLSKNHLEEGNSLHNFHNKKKRGEIKKCKEEKKGDILQEEKKEGKGIMFFGKKGRMKE
jgi:hypothetical protein